MFDRLPARSRRRRRPRGDLVGALRALDIDDPVAGEEFFRFGERSVGDFGRAVLAGPNDSRLSRRREPFGAHQLTGIAELLVAGFS